MARCIASDGPRRRPHTGFMTKKKCTRPTPGLSSREGETTHSERASRCTAMRAQRVAARRSQKGKRQLQMASSPLCYIGGSTTSNLRKGATHEIRVFRHARRIRRPTHRQGDRTSSSNRRIGTGRSSGNQHHHAYRYAWNRRIIRSVRSSCSALSAAIAARNSTVDLGGGTGAADPSPSGAAASSVGRAGTVAPAICSASRLIDKHSGLPHLNCGAAFLTCDTSSIAEWHLAQRGREVSWGISVSRRCRLGGGDRKIAGQLGPNLVPVVWAQVFASDSAFCRALN